MPDDGRAQRFALEEYAGLEGRDLISAIHVNHPGRVALVSSFGAESAVLLHMASQVNPAMPVIFLDTQKLFPETLRYRDDLVRRLGLTGIRTITPDSRDLLLLDHEGNLHRTSADACCHIRKTLPLERALSGFDAVISGRKRFHGGERKGLSFVNLADGRLKAEPLAAFTAFDLKSYAAEHDLPPHPLVAEGYRSIGCLPCTIKGGDDENPRAGRWADSEKTECGIHWTANGRPIRVSQPQPLLETC